MLTWQHSAVMVLPLTIAGEWCALYRTHRQLHTVPVEFTTSDNMNMYFRRRKFCDKQEFIMMSRNNGEWKNLLVKSLDMHTFPVCNHCCVANCDGWDFDASFAHLEEDVATALSELFLMESVTANMHLRRSWNAVNWCTASWGSTHLEGDGWNMDYDKKM